jgi:hypothetical protein
VHPVTTCEYITKWYKPEGLKSKANVSTVMENWLGIEGKGHGNPGGRDRHAAVAKSRLLQALIPTMLVAIVPKPQPT